MFIKNCVQTFIMDGREVVILIEVLERGQHINFYAVPIEIAEELKLDEYDGKDIDSEDALMERIKDFYIERKKGQKLPCVKINELW